MKKKLKLPRFRSAKGERRFWSKVNLADYFERSDFVPASFPNLKPSSRSVSIRIPEYLLISLKEKANELNIPYQTLIKQFIARGLWAGTAVSGGRP